MAELTIVGKLERRTVGRRTPKPVAPPPTIAPARPPKPDGPTRLARQLALAHHIEALIDSGLVKDYADAARRLGITRARVTQIANLAFLPTATQESILLGTCNLSERQLRSQARCETEPTRS